MKPKKDMSKVLQGFTKQVRNEIDGNYRTREKFCFENEIDTALISRFLSKEQRDFRVSTLDRIAKGLKKRLVIKLE